MKVAVILFCMVGCYLACDTMKIGVWNTMRQPWLKQWEKLVNNHIVQDDIDILHLVEIWTDVEASKILARPDVRLTYPYYYRPQKRNTEKCGCNHNPYFKALGTNFLNCVIRTGTNPREIIEPSTGKIADECYTFALQIVLFNPSNTTNGFLCFACIINSAQNYKAGSFGVDQIMTQCDNNGGPLYAYQGESGQLILSKCPLEAVEEEFSYAWLSNRINIYATYGGVTIGFGHFAYNLLEDINPLYASLMYGDTQYHQASQMLARSPDVIVGDLNTGFNYQPAGYNLLLSRYDSTFCLNTNTYCPASHRSFPACLGVQGQAVDHILVRRGSEVDYDYAELFNVHPLMSDHVGVKTTIYPD
jgi:endonuclease/exonuclease/phosphatase family metal-dependent hydrolase